MQCPVCDDKLREIEKYGVMVDICPSCKGVWLDRGELEKIAKLEERDDSGRQGRDAHDNRRDRDDDHERRDRHDDDRERYRDHARPEGHGYGRSKKRSFLSDLMEGFGD